MSGYNGKLIPSIDCKELYSYETSENIIHKNKEIKYSNIIKQYKHVCLTLIMLLEKIP